MNLATILSILKSEPMYCESGWRARVLKTLNDHAAMSKDQFKATREGVDECGEPVELPQTVIDGSLAIIPITGPVGIGFGAFEKGKGCVDLEDVRDDIKACLANNEVDNLVLYYDTPGGMVNGTPELAADILEYKKQKPIYAFVAKSCCSAGFYTAASCNGIFVAPTARIGNIGACMAVEDISRMAQAQGIDVKMFTSGDIKGYGTEGTSLSAKQTAFLQGRVDHVAEQFFAHIRSTRPQVAAADMQGQWYWGTEAVDRGFADDVVNSLDELKAFLS